MVLKSNKENLPNEGYAERCHYEEVALLTIVIHISLSVDMNSSVFSLDACRSMIAMLDVSNSAV